MNKVLFLLLMTLTVACNKKMTPPTLSYEEQISHWQEEERTTYIQAFNVFEERVFTPEDFTFYPTNTSYRVEATLTLTPDSEVFEMPTSGTKTPRYKAYATADFTLGGKQHSLTVYENLDLQRRSPEYADYLFCPFYDLTSGETSYGGGRYMDFTKPSDGKIIMDFNKCYNPYCAYLDKFNCPITPRENTLDIEVLAGMRLDSDH